jgi:hypothetical protein
VSTIPFKMFGLQRTCTNITRKLILNNFRVRSMEIGAEWKHGPVKEVFSRTVDGEPIRMVFMVKDPYAWAYSCYRYFQNTFRQDNTNCGHFRKKWSFEKFVRSPHYNWQSPAHRWSVMNRHYLSAAARAPDRSIVLHAERAYGDENQKAVIAGVQMAFRLDKLSDEPWTCNKRLSHGRVTDAAMDVSHFEERRYLDKYAPEMLDHFNKGLAPGLMEELGYTFVGP